MTGFDRDYLYKTVKEKVKKIADEDGSIPLDKVRSLTLVNSIIIDAKIDILLEKLSSKEDVEKINDTLAVVGHELAQQNKGW